MNLKPETLVLLAAHDSIMCLGWTQNAYSRNECGVEVVDTSPAAACFCASGAIYSVGSTEAITLRSFGFLKIAIGGEFVAPWNDKKSRTKKQVLDAFMRAAELSEAQP